MSFGLVNTLAMNILRMADGFYHVLCLMYFCHDFVLTDRTDAEMFLTCFSLIHLSQLLNLPETLWYEERQRLHLPVTKDSL